MGPRALISGSLAFPDGSPPAGSPVDVLFASAGSAFTRLGGAVAGADGAWSATVTLPQTGAVRARFPGDPTRAALESSDLQITILPRLGIRLSSNRIWRGHRTVASGTVTPPGRGGAEVVLERRVGRRWVIEQRKRTPILSGRYRTLVRPRRAGLYRLWIKSGGSSASRRVRVLAR